jgi:phage terminase large subunit-like protein
VPPLQFIEGQGTPRGYLRKTGKIHPPSTPKDEHTWRGVVKAGPKVLPSAGPLDLSHLPASGGDRVIEFIQHYCRIPKGVGARGPFLLRDWQRDIVHALFDDPRPSTGVVSLPRGQGKTVLAAAIALYGLFGEGIEGPSVAFVASDERQAGIGYNAARRMVELSPELRDRCVIYRDRIKVPETDGELRALPAEAASLQGGQFSLAVVDELHVVKEDTWEAVVLASGKYPESLTLAISTPAASQDSVMWKLREHGRRGDDPAFRWVEYAAPMDCAIDDEDAWAIACPALDDFFSRDHMRATLRTSRESSFRRYRLGQWVGAEGAWMPADRWEACREDIDLPDGTPIVIGFDGSQGGIGAGHDATAMVACTVDDERPHLFVLGLWEGHGQPGWSVPREEVHAALVAAADRFDLVELVADPPYWRAELEAWSRLWPGRVLEFPTNRWGRMAPAVDRFMQTVMTCGLSHDGDERLSAHIANAVVKTVPGGEVITKPDKHSPHKVDAAIASVLALSRAQWHAANTTKPMEGVVFL